MGSHRIDIRGIPVEVVRKSIKNLHIGVYPPSGRVRVAAPLWLDDDAVRLAVISRLGWIRRKQAEFAQQDRQSQREFVAGESHYFRGRRYRLDVIEHDGPPGGSSAQQHEDGVARPPRHRPRRKGVGTGAMVSPSAPRPIARAVRQMGADGWGGGR